MGAANLASGSGCSSVVPGQANHAGWGAAELIFPSLVQEIHSGWPTGRMQINCRFGLSMAFLWLSYAFFTSTWPRAPGVLAGALTCFTFHSLLRPVYLSIPWHRNMLAD